MGKNLKHTTLSLMRCSVLAALPLSLAWANEAQTLNERLLQPVTSGEPFANVIVRDLLRQGADPNYKDSSGKSMVDYAKKQSQKGVLAELLSVGAHISFEDWLYAYANAQSFQAAYTKLPFAYKKAQKSSQAFLTEYYGTISYHRLRRWYESAPSKGA